MPVVSFKCNREERRRIKAMAAEQGYVYVSELIRHALGLGPGFGPTAPSPIQERVMDVIDPGQLASVVIELCDRMDMFQRQQTRIAKHIGIPEEDRHLKSDPVAPKVIHDNGETFAR